MSYSAEISRLNPTCFLFLLDQSGSMADGFGSGESTKRKCDGVSDAINKLLQELAIRCAKPEGVRDYFHIGVIGYGAKVGPSFGGSLTNKELVPISEVASSPLRIEERVKKVEDGAGGLVEQKTKFPIWFEPLANGGTPMCQALTIANSIVQRWITQHPDCFPPVILNLTDGEPTDGDPRTLADALKKLSGSDGNTLLLNLHISSNKATQIFFPDSDGELPDDHARLLFQMSSIMTDTMRAAAQEHGYKVSVSSRGYILNAGAVEVIQWLDIGTRAANLR